MCRIIEFERYCFSPARFMVYNSIISNVCNFLYIRSSRNKQATIWFTRSRSWIGCRISNRVFRNDVCYVRLGEYANILLMCSMGSILFLCGWLSPINIYPFTLVPAPLWLIFKILLLFILFSLVKAIVPRYRYDQLMKLGWKIFLPFSLIWLILTSSYLFYFNLLPVN